MPASVEAFPQLSVALAIVYGLLGAASLSLTLAARSASDGAGNGGGDFLQKEGAAVLRMADAIDRRLQRCIFPWQLHLLVRLFACLPRWLQRRRGK